MSGAILELGIVAAMAFFGYIIYDFYRMYKDSNVYERRYVAAYRVGLIKQKAEQNGIALDLPPETDKYVEKLESDIVKRINTPPSE